MKVLEHVLEEIVLVVVPLFLICVSVLTLKKDDKDELGCAGVFPFAD